MAENTPHAELYLSETARIASELDPIVVERIAQGLVDLRNRGGRLFFLGVGGSAGNASHAVNDFRKLARIETYTPTDNVSELTARANDEGFPTVFVEWLKTSRLNDNDAVFVLSVGGGSVERKVSVNIVEALKFASTQGAKIYGIVSRDGGYTKQVADEVVLIPTIRDDAITPHAESFQSVVLHCLVSHPAVLNNSFKWEGIK